jgi:hypothetical protein
MNLRLAPLQARADQRSGAEKNDLEQLQSQLIP